MEERRHPAEKFQWRGSHSPRHAHFFQVHSRENHFAGRSKVQMYCLRSGGLAPQSRLTVNNSRRSRVGNYRSLREYIEILESHEKLFRIRREVYRETAL